jgi:hypothetical protein
MSFKITLACEGIDASVGATAAQDIQAEFREHRRWHREINCRFENGALILSGSNDFDKNGLAFLDEFGDCLSAYLKNHGAVRVLSVDAEQARHRPGFREACFGSVLEVDAHIGEVCFAPINGLRHSSLSGPLSARLRHSLGPTCRRAS